MRVTNHPMEDHLRYVPFVRNLRVRTAVGLVLVILSVIAAGAIVGTARIGAVFLMTALAWIGAVFLTDKYVHKYPQRYFTYLLASHLKAAIIMGFFLWIMAIIAGPLVAPPSVLWLGYLFFIFGDAMVSIPRRRDISEARSFAAGPSLHEERTDEGLSEASGAAASLPSINKQMIMGQIRSQLDEALVRFIEKQLPDQQGATGEVLFLDDMPATEDQSDSAPVSLLVGLTRMNDVRRLDRFLAFCVKQIALGGFFLIPYLPLENVAKDLRHRYKGLLYWTVSTLHFMWYRALPKIPWLDSLYFWSKMSWLDALHLSVTKRRNRVLSKAEVWGRLSYCGMQVIAESKGEGELYVLAQRTGMPVKSRRPSYYPIVALEKIGLDGKIIHTHKIRTMFPFSEFLQKRIFEDHGLAASGKFKNDFRLTGFGKFLRRYWLDELPQVFDWLQGDIKLVGMRATSRQFLSLYPKHFLDLYVKIKPGLIPPIYDESTNGLSEIVEVELTYLRCYWDRPFRTDVRYLYQTFIDIVFKGIRSR